MVEDLLVRHRCQGVSLEGGDWASKISRGSCSCSHTGKCETSEAKNQTTEQMANCDELGSSQVVVMALEALGLSRSS